VAWSDLDHCRGLLTRPVATSLIVDTNTSRHIPNEISQAASHSSGDESNTVKPAGRPMNIERMRATSANPR
ncbi:MAG: hypothetical protein ACREAB_19360, partial [Blastocatellia bacterium]